MKVGCRIWIGHGAGPTRAVALAGPHHGARPLLGP